MKTYCSFEKSFQIAIHWKHDNFEPMPNALHEVGKHVRCDPLATRRHGDHLRTHDAPGGSSLTHDAPGRTIDGHVLGLAQGSCDDPVGPRTLWMFTRSMFEASFLQSGHVNTERLALLAKVVQQHSEVNASSLLRVRPARLAPIASDKCTNETNNWNGCG